MILYKYVGFDAGREIIENLTMGFSEPQHFNDPFDLPSYPTETSENLVENLFSGLRKWGKNNAWARNTGILALTRTPTNPLMWAHYADQHRGMVIGIDAVAAGFTEEKSNLIPAQYGSVIYVSRRPSNPFIGNFKSPLKIGGTHYFPSDHYEKLQRLFLHKSICWSYEEEVRVLKCLKGISGKDSKTLSGTFNVIDIGGRDMYLYSIPKKALVEVYFGVRSNAVHDNQVYDALKANSPATKVHKCNLDEGNLVVGADIFQS